MQSFLYLQQGSKIKGMPFLLNRIHIYELKLIENVKKGGNVRKMNDRLPIKQRHDYCLLHLH